MGVARRKKINKYIVKHMVSQEVTNDMKKIECAEGEKEGLGQDMYHEWSVLYRKGTEITFESRLRCSM